MSTFNYTVDTQPMAEEISRVSHHVNATTGAVVAMQTAVILAEEKAADHVCSNVNKGFYSLIRSQISQKLAKLQADADSYTMHLVQQKNALLGIKSRMQRDYNMISNRYIKLFNGLNANLRQRIFELDKPTIDFACKEIDKVSNRTKYLSATVPITQLESVTISQKIIASNVKHKGLNVINSMRWFIHQMNEQKKLTDHILLSDGNSKQTSLSYIPLAIFEYNRDNSDQKNTEIVLPDVEIDNLTGSSIKNKAFDKFSQLDWSQKHEDNQEIKSEFIKMLSSSDKPSRIKDLAMQLFQSGNYQTI